MYGNLNRCDESVRYSERGKNTNGGLGKKLFGLWYVGQGDGKRFLKKDPACN